MALPQVHPQGTRDRFAPIAIPILFHLTINSVSETCRKQKITRDLRMQVSGKRTSVELYMFCRTCQMALERSSTASLNLTASVRQNIAAMRRCPNSNKRSLAFRNGAEVLKDQRRKEAASFATVNLELIRTQPNTKDRGQQQASISGTRLAKRNVGNLPA